MRVATGLRAGYEAAAVEDFIEAAQDALRAPTPRISAIEVASHRFKRVRFKPGYDMDDVDRYLTEVEHLLYQRESGQLTRAAARGGRTSVRGILREPREATHR